MRHHDKLVVGELALFTQNIENREKVGETMRNRTKEVLVGTKFVNSTCMLGKQFLFSWHIVPRKCLQRKSSLHHTPNSPKGVI